VSNIASTVTSSTNTATATTSTTTTPSPKPDQKSSASEKSNAPNKASAPPASKRTAAAQTTKPTENTNSLSVTASTPKPASAMESAYAAYLAGNAEEANRLYREVLKNDPTQPDAWLGLAVIAHANNQREPAMNAYKRVLRLEPQNPTALAGVNSLNNKTNEPRQESQLRELLARSPQEADLNHALGVVLSAEQRWSEAQPLFFKAHALSPQEPQYAYNLAVTLDHLRKSALAAQYYETALTLAKGKTNAFDENAARTRLAALKASNAPKSTP
jgi:Flp pilus assembly protein TadD